MTPNHRWTKGAYSCHKCGTVSKDYRACDVGQCDHLCGDLYADAREADSCKAGCAHYHKLQLSCDSPAILKACQDWGFSSKQDNGCQAYAKGWKKGTYNCHKCGTVSKDYRACDLGQCKPLCGDLYADAREADSCKALP